MKKTHKYNEFILENKIYEQVADILIDEYLAENWLTDGFNNVKKKLSGISLDKLNPKKIIDSMRSKLFDKAEGDKVNNFQRFIVGLVIFVKLSIALGLTSHAAVGKEQLVKLSENDKNKLEIKWDGPNLGEIKIGGKTVVLDGEDLKPIEKDVTKAIEDIKKNTNDTSVKADEKGFTSYSLDKIVKVGELPKDAAHGKLAASPGGDGQPSPDYKGETKGLHFDKFGYPDKATDKKVGGPIIDNINSEVQKGVEELKGAIDENGNIEKLPDGLKIIVQDGKKIIVKYIKGLPYKIGEQIPGDTDTITDFMVEVKVPSDKTTGGDKMTIQHKVTDKLEDKQNTVANKMFGIDYKDMPESLKNIVDGHLNLRVVQSIL